MKCLSQTLKSFILLSDSIVVFNPLESDKWVEVNYITLYRFIVYLKNVMQRI